MQARMPDRSGGELVEGRTRLESLPTPAGNSTILPKLRVAPLQPSQPRLASFYEANALGTFRAIWRKRFFIAGCLAAGIAIAIAAIVSSAKYYRAEAVIQLDFAARQSGAAASAPGANIDAGILVEGEARLIRSPTLARRVIARLKLDEDPSYNRVGLLARLLSYVSPPRPDMPTMSPTDRAAVRLAKQVNITNDTRAYLITISVVSGAPEHSAKLANAFATEYLQYRVIQQLQQAEATSQVGLRQARATFGDKHPAVIQAKAQLDAAAARLHEQETRSPDDVIPPPGTSYLRAEPVSLPAGPNPVAFLGMGIVGSLAASIGLALLMDRRNTSFRSERSVPAETGLRCVGMIPRFSERSTGERRMEVREAYRSLCLTVGLAGQRVEGPQVVLLSTALPTKSRGTFVRGLAASLKEDGKRTLIIDLAEANAAGKAISLDDVIYNPALVREFLSEHKDQPVAELRRKSGQGGARSPLASFARADWGFEQLLDEARAHYDAILLDTPPTLLFADSIFLGRFADLCLHVVVWNKTPRATVLEALRRLQDHMVRVDGIVLIDVDLARYPAYETGDRTYYLSKYNKLFSSEA